MTLPDLITKLERAEGGSRELDAEIRAVLLAEDGAYAAKSPFNGEWCVYKGIDRADKPKLYENRRVPHELWNGAYSTSIDAAVALVNRLLPGAKWEITTTGFKSGCTIVCGGTVVGGAYAATPALAVIAAALRALSKDTDHDHE